REAFGRLQEGFLENIGVIQAALEVAAEAEADHALERLAVAGEQLGHGRGIARGSALEQVGEIFRVRHCGSPPTLLCAERSLFSSGSFSFFSFSPMADRYIGCQQAGEEMEEGAARGVTRTFIGQRATASPRTTTRTDPMTATRRLWWLQDVAA